MIEEEVREPKERELVAAVIYNRLEAGMVLGIDSTLRYGLGIPATEPLRQSQLEGDNPYNTRKLAGLPPTPISKTAYSRSSARVPENESCQWAEKASVCCSVMSRRFAQHRCIRTSMNSS